MTFKLFIGFQEHILFSHGKSIAAKTDFTSSTQELEIHRSALASSTCHHSYIVTSLEAPPRGLNCFLWTEAVVVEGYRHREVDAGGQS